MIFLRNLSIVFSILHQSNDRFLGAHIMKLSRSLQKVYQFFMLILFGMFSNDVTAQDWKLTIIFIYNILGFVRLWSSFPSIRPVIHPSKFLIPEEEYDGRGGGRMAAVAVYRNVYVIQSCSLWKTPVVLQFAKSYKLI